MIKRLFFLLIFVPAICGAIDFETSGYLKYLFSSTRYPFFNQTLNDHLLHARLNTRWFVTSRLNAVAEMRFRTYYAQSVEQFPSFKQLIRNSYPLVNLQWEVLQNGRWYGLAEMDRFNLDYQADDWQLTVGRQRIAWGTALVWNVIDLFNPLSFLDFDYEERPGSDAVRFQYFTGALSRVEIVTQPEKKWKDQTSALFWNTHLGEYDLFFLAGIKKRRRTAGLAWSGYIKDAGFRGEILLSDPLNRGPQLPAPAPGIPSLTQQKKLALRLVVSADYSFPNSFYVHGEVLFQNDGVKKLAGLYLYQAPRAGLVSPSRWSLFGETAFDLHPLVRGDLFSFYNPDDKSYLLAPSLNISLITDLDLYVIGFITHGGATSEFGAIGRAGFLRLKYSF